MKDGGRHPKAGEQAPSSPPGQTRGPFKLWLGDGEGTGSDVRICKVGLTTPSKLPPLSLPLAGRRAK